MAKVMTINSGSSSLKFKLYEMPEEKVLAAGNCERIGLADGIFTIKYGDKKDKEQRLYLHANRLKMYYPIIKKDILFETKTPKEFKKLI